MLDDQLLGKFLAEQRFVGCCRVRGRSTGSLPLSPPWPVSPTPPAHSAPAPSRFSGTQPSPAWGFLHLLSPLYLQCSCSRRPRTFLPHCPPGQLRSARTHHPIKQHTPNSCPHGRCLAHQPQLPEGKWVSFCSVVHPFPWRGSLSTTEQMK